MHYRYASITGITTLIWCSLRLRQCCKCITYTNSFNPRESPGRSVPVLSAFWKWGAWDRKQHAWSHAVAGGRGSNPTAWLQPPLTCATCLCCQLRRMSNYCRDLQRHGSVKFSAAGEGFYTSQPKSFTTESLFTSHRNTSSKFSLTSS